VAPAHAVDRLQVGAGEQVGRVAQRVDHGLVDRRRVHVADERLGLQVAVGDHDRRRLLDVDAAGDLAVLGDLVEGGDVHAHTAVPAVDLAQRGAHGLVVDRLAVP
jgi:hypothetical protein